MGPRHEYWLLWFTLRDSNAWFRNLCRTVGYDPNVVECLHEHARPLLSDIPWMEPRPDLHAEWCRLDGPTALPLRDLS